MKKATFAILALSLAVITAEAGIKEFIREKPKAKNNQELGEKIEPVKIPEAELWYPIGLSFTPTIAAFPSKEDGVCGLRLGIISANREMHGLSMNLIGDYDEYSSNALRISPIWNSSFISERTIDVSAILNMTGRAFLTKGSGSCSGVQLAFFLNFSFGDFHGVQIGAGNFARELSGLQFGLVNNNSGASGLMLGACNYSKDFSGLQVGIANYCDDEAKACGLQFGGVNIAGELHGLQIGIANYAKAGRGLQIGIINFFGHEDSLLILPVANAKF